MIEAMQNLVDAAKNAIEHEDNKEGFRAPWVQPLLSAVEATIKNEAPDLGGLSLSQTQQWKLRFVLRTCFHVMQKEGYTNLAYSLKTEIKSLLGIDLKESE